MVIDARQVECGYNGDADTICSPQKGAIWENSTWQQIIWNPSYPNYATNEFIDIYLYFVKNYQSIMVKNWTTIELNLANFPVFVDDTWFPAFYQKEDNIHEAFIYVVGSDVNPDQEMLDRYSDYPAPIPIQVVQKIDPITTKNDNTTAINDSDKTDSNSTGILQPWVIAIVAIACVAAVVACLAMLWTIRHVRRRKLVFNEKGHEVGGIGEPATTTTATTITTTRNLSSPSIMYPGNNSSTQLGSNNNYIFPPVLDRSTRSNSLPSRIILEHCGSNYLPPDNMIIRPQSIASCSNVSTPSNDTPPISSADALVIADTFRQRMRRPEWQQQQQQQQQQLKQEHDEESKRRQLSEELLKKELAAEGALMKKVGKRAHLLSAFLDGEEEEVDDDVAVVADAADSNNISDNHIHNNNHNHDTSFPLSRK